MVPSRTRSIRHLRSVLVCPLLLLTAYASNEVCLTPVESHSVTPSATSESSGHIGTLARWGGTLIEIRHRKDNTDLEILAYPLNDCGRPRVGATHRGRFILVYPGFLEAADYRTGQKLSAIGLIIGIRRRLNIGIGGGNGGVFGEIGVVF